MYRIALLISLVPLAFGVVAGCGDGSSTEAPAAVEVSPVVVEAQFTGDVACASCHADIVEAYSQTNHKRGFSRFKADEAIERFDVERVVYNEHRNVHYEVYVKGDTLYQREYREDVNGALVHELIQAADYVIGSGNATRSYLLENNGYLTEMPLTWYVERGYWDMSPGYTQANDRFSRKIILDCLTCHNAIPTHSPSTQNHFTDIPEGISCERCHGPASLHVDFWTANQSAEAPDVDTTIVNPAAPNPRPADVELPAMSPGRRCCLQGRARCHNLSQWTRAPRE